MYQHDQKPNTTLTTESRALLDNVKKNDVVVLCGRNNCGKSYLLKLMTQAIGETASFLEENNRDQTPIIGVRPQYFFISGIRSLAVQARSANIPPA